MTLPYPANIPPAEWDSDVDECQACHRLFPVARLIETFTLATSGKYAGKIIAGEVCYDCAEAGR